MNRHKSALLLMDYQNDVVDPEGALGRLGTAALLTEHGTLAAAARLLDGARDAGLPVIHVAVAFRQGFPDADPGVPLSKLCIDLNCLIEGTWGAAFIQPLAPRPGEPVVVKRGMSAFAGTDLDLLLRLAGSRSLILAGVASNLVVEATARHGVDMGYRAIIPADASMGFTAEQHDQSLGVLERFARVTTVDEVLRELRRT